jgi:lipopolysaccharide transport system permease protein
LAGSIARWPLALMLALNDINNRYRRTVLGPLWITLGQAATIGGFVLVFSHLLRSQPESYALYLAAGIPVWVLVSQSFNDMPLTFAMAKPFIESFELPWLLHIWRKAFSYIIVFCHHLATLAAVMLYERVPPRWEMLYAAPALLVITIAGAGLGMIVAILGARYRDLQPALMVISTTLFLFTPVMWRAEQLQVNTWIYQFNPLYYYIELLRAPLLGMAPPAQLWAGTIAGAIMLFISGFAAFVVSRRRLYHWL